MAKKDNKPFFGAKWHPAKTKDGNPAISGWRKLFDGRFVSYLAFPTEKTKEFVSEKGTVSYGWAIKITTDEGIQQWDYGFYYPGKNRFMCKNRNIMLSPDSGKNGYAGGYLGKR